MNVKVHYTSLDRLRWQPTMLGHALAKSTNVDLSRINFGQRNRSNLDTHSALWLLPGFDPLNGN